jgi:hypothetical protein
MKTFVFFLILTLASMGAWADFICPDGTREACLADGDSICPMTAKCVDDAAVCLDPESCESARGFICVSEYDAVLGDYEKVVGQYNQLISENVELREVRLEQKNCVINAQSLKEAIRCVR